MARPHKIGLDYFPMDINFSKEVSSIEALFGNDGLVWVVKFWMEAYSTVDGSVDFSGLFSELFANKCRISLEKHNKILDAAIKIKFCYECLPNSETYTSNDIQARISSVSKDRADAILRQNKRKEEESKEKESKVKETGSYSANNSRIIESGIEGGCEERVAGVSKTIEDPGNAGVHPIGGYADELQKFDRFRRAYPGTRRGLGPEFDNFKKKNKNWKEIIPMLLPALQKQREVRHKNRLSGAFVPEWKNLTTWINQQCWTEEAGESVPPPQPEYNQDDNPALRRF